MHTNSPDTGAISTWLAQAHAAREPFRPFAAARGVTSLPQAYEVQRGYVHLQQQARGAQPAGYKIGLTSTAMQAMCGIDTPVAGVVLADGVHRSGARLPASAHGRLGVEFELAVRLGRDLPADRGAPSIAEVRAAVEAVAPAIELIDDRGCDYASLDVLSLVADNAWNAGIVLGEFRGDWPELAGVEGVVTDAAGQELDRGRGIDVLGHPLAPVAWLAQHLHAAGERLRAGQIVMTGSLVRTRFVVPGEQYRFEVSGLGAVTLAVVP